MSHWATVQPKLGGLAALAAWVKSQPDNVVLCGLPGVCNLNTFLRDLEDRVWRKYAATAGCRK